MQSNMQIHVNLIQHHISFGDPQENWEKVIKVLNHLPHLPGQLYLLPELWTTAYDLTHMSDHAEENEKILRAVNDFAIENNIILGGSMVLRTGKLATNTFTLSGLESNQPDRYDKIHLFKLMNEDRWLSPGKRPVITHLQGIQTGLTVCYDLRFPELFRYYALQGCQLVLLVAEWPLTRINHWRALLQARAIENLMYIAAVNTVGKIHDTTFGGGSVIFSPWGEVIGEGGNHDEEVVTGTIDTNYLTEIRRKYPFLSDRRPERYE